MTGAGNRLKRFVKAAYRARDIVRQLLAFSRKQTLEFQTIDLNKIISDFYGLLRRTIREDICIENILDPSIPFINADPGQLEQIIMNLAVNAQDAMPKEGSTFKIYFPVAQQNISVHETDTGAPMQNRQGTETILVVEDDARVLEMTRSILNRQGYRVLSASKASISFKNHFR